MLITFTTKERGGVMKPAGEKVKAYRSEGDSRCREGKALCVGVLILFALSFLTEQTAAQERRSLRVWVDTLDLNLCAIDEDVPFDNWGIWLETASESDTVIGFRPQDSVLSCSIEVLWDVSRIRLEPPYALTPPQTLFARFSSKLQQVDTNIGQLYIEMSAMNLKSPAVGTDIPLFYMKGRFLKTDTAIGPPEGGAKTDAFKIIDGDLKSNISTSRFVPGFIRAIRDTTPEYTGTLRASEEDLDTNRTDTVSLFIRNFANRKVRKVRFSLHADTMTYRFIGTVVADMVSGVNWSGKEVKIAPDLITGHFVSKTDISSEDSLVLRVEIERTTDSAFFSFLTIDEFGVNDESCLGKLVVERGSVSGKKIPVRDSVDTTMSLARRERDLYGGIQVVSLSQGNALQIITTGRSLQSISMYDVTGIRIKHWADFTAGKEVIVNMEQKLQSGMYFLVIRDIAGNIWNRQFIQQTTVNYSLLPQE